MMKIQKIEPIILHVPLKGAGISDSTNSISHWGFAGAIIHASNGLKGYGFTGTHAYLKGDQLITSCISEVYSPLLKGETIEAISCIKRLWKKLHDYPPLRWIGRAGISHLALAAIDIALWDLFSKSQAVPLRTLLGKNNNQDTLSAYNTNAGWLNIPTNELADGCRRSMDEGFKGVKIKVGQQDPADDLRRIEAVRKVIGMDYALMIDGNGKWSLDTALKYCGAIDDFQLDWFEEPLYFDDLTGHARLIKQMKTPVALGEQLYSYFHFDAFMEAGAVSIVQVDALRVAGVTEWLRVADRSMDLGLPVVPHVGDMMQLHQHLSMGHPSSMLLEYIPWTRHCFEEPATVIDGLFKVPVQPGASTTITRKAYNEYSKALK